MNGTCSIPAQDQIPCRDETGKRITNTEICLLKQCCPVKDRFTSQINCYQPGGTLTNIKGTHDITNYY